MVAMQQSSEVDTLALVAREVAKITNRESVAVDVSLAELGVDSINVIELILFCEQLYGTFDPTSLQINEFTTLADLDLQLKSTGMAAEA
jgi:acyl carrier protein